MPHQPRAPKTTPAPAWLATSVGVVLVFAPLFRAGLQPLALLALELAALAMVLAVLWRPAPLTRREWVALALLGLLPVVYLIPLPIDLVAALPGRAPYIDAWRTAFGAAGMPSTATLSLIPSATQAAWLVLTIPIAVFLATRAVPARQQLVLVSVLLVIAGAEATLGLMQFGGGPDSVLHFGMEFAHFDSAVGTYTNRNHLAGLLEMALPLTLALLFFSVGQGRDRRPVRRRERAALLALAQGQQTLIYAALAILLLVAMAFTRSRTGLVLSMLAILLSVVLFARRIGGDNTFGTLGTVIAIAIGLVVTIGLVPVLDRFTSAGVIENQRWIIFNTTLSAIRDFFPIGSGPGTFPDVYPAFQPLELGPWVINRAHNDYLDWVFEGGVLALALVGFLLYLYAAQWRKVWSGQEWSRLRFVQVGAGVGILLVLCHELLDYNLHTPANMAYFALLLGIFFSPAPAPGTRPSGHRPQVGGEGALPIGYTSVIRHTPAPDQIRNPFLDD